MVVTTLQQEGSAPHLSVVESVLVAPSASAPDTASLPLTFFDVFWLNSKPVERVLFYRLASDANNDTTTAILSNLRTSLSRALGVFYPLAGHLRLTPGSKDRHELHYHKGDGVTFSVADYDGDVDELATDEPRQLTKLLPLAPTLPDGGAVLAVQATVLRGGCGLAVGLVVHHAACDGASFTRFLRTWAAASTGAGAPPPPIINRALVEDPSCMYDVFVKGMASSYAREYVKMADDQMLATFTLSQQDIQRVKDVVLQLADGAMAPRCSSLVATFSFVWSCYQRAKDDNGGGETYLLVPVDQRSRMKPAPIPDGYFGNCISPAMHAAPNDQLALAGADGILAAFTAVAAAIEQAMADGGIGSPELWKKKIRDAVSSGGGFLPVAGSPRFRLYDIDFGFGRPAKVDTVSVARTGALAVAESRRSRDTVGGIEVGISLPQDAMLRFQNCFHEAITWLRQH